MNAEIIDMGMLDKLQGDLDACVTDIKRLTNLVNAQRRCIDQQGEMASRLINEKAAALVKIEHLRNAEFGREVSANSREKHCAKRVAEARAAGYEAGQRAMRERAAQTVSNFSTYDGSFDEGDIAEYLLELPILSEPEEGQS